MKPFLALGVVCFLISSTTHVNAQQYRNNCYSTEGSEGPSKMTYCIFTEDKGSSKEIIISYSGGRESPKAIRYFGKSFTPGSRFSNDYYPEQGAKFILEYFGNDKIVLGQICSDPGYCNPTYTYRR